VIPGFTSRCARSNWLAIPRPLQTHSAVHSACPTGSPSGCSTSSSSKSPLFMYSIASHGCRSPAQRRFSRSRASTVAHVSVCEKNSSTASRVSVADVSGSRSATVAGGCWTSGRRALVMISSAPIFSTILRAHVTARSGVADSRPLPRSVPGTRGCRPPTLLSRTRQDCPHEPKMVHAHTGRRVVRDVPIHVACESPQRVPGTTCPRWERQSQQRPPSPQSGCLVLSPSNPASSSKSDGF
jgi:hypothetical protein